MDLAVVDHPGIVISGPAATYLIQTIEYQIFIIVSSQF